MKFFNIFILLFFVYIGLFSSSHDYSNFKINFPLNIRVLLNEKNSIEKNVFTINSKDSVITLQSPNIKQKVTISEKDLNIIVKDNSIFIPVANEKKNNLVEIKRTKSKEIQITSSDNQIKLNGKPYQGTLIFKIDSSCNKLFIINTVNLDDYLYSVLISESYQNWPMEVQKAQVVAFRSYAVNCILKARNSKHQKSYDLKRTNFHQTYNGFHKYIHLRRAIDETKNLILTFDGKVILAMFDACCGGIIPAKMKVLDFKKAPYLARRHRCNFCNNYNLYQWKRVISEQEFLHRLKCCTRVKSQFNNCGNLRSIFVDKKDAAGIVHNVKIWFSKMKSQISGMDLWKNFRDKIKSLSFNVKKHKKQIIFSGKGFGHQIGLCQRGAREMVKRGYDFKRILKFYYPKTQFARLQYAKV
ncbi:SpoIID/LytB domain-containing protein [Candidatus Dependentiae bacterium]|nr:SpoIID/LytB domain-containing protein [Candidatus Dependentiae bacterium]